MYIESRYSRIYITSKLPLFHPKLARFSRWRSYCGGHSVQILATFKPNRFCVQCKQKLFLQCTANSAKIYGRLHSYSSAVYAEPVKNIYDFCSNTNLILDFATHIFYICTSREKLPRYSRLFWSEAWFMCMIPSSSWTSAATYLWSLLIPSGKLEDVMHMLYVQIPIFVSNLVHNPHFCSC